MDKNAHRAAVAALWVVVVFVIACGGGSSAPSAPNAPNLPATVTFTYQAATAIDPATRAQFPNCVNGASPTHIHPGWQGFTAVPLPPFPPDRFEITFTDVPVESRQSVRISDPNGCDVDPNGASTRNVFANGVLLTNIVGTPGNGTEPGLAFTVAADNTVTP